MLLLSKRADPDHTRRRRRGGWSGSTILHMSEGHFSHDAGQMSNMFKMLLCSDIHTTYRGLHQ